MLLGLNTCRLKAQNEIDVPSVARLVVHDVHDGIEAPGTVTDRTKLNGRAVGHGAGHLDPIGRFSLAGW